jgi:hypothetical protein
LILFFDEDYAYTQKRRLLKIGLFLAQSAKEEESFPD